MSKIARMSAGATSLTARCQGGGDKKQGLTPNATGFNLGPFAWRAAFGGLTDRGNGRGNGSVNYEFRQYFISITNQIGGIGRYRRQTKYPSRGISLFGIRNSIKRCSGFRNINVVLGNSARRLNCNFEVIGPNDKGNCLIDENNIPDNLPAPIIISSFASIINLRIDQVFIGLYLNDEILGNYSASAKIGEAWLVVPAVLSISVFPILNEIRSKNYNRFRQLLNQSVVVLSLIGIAFCLIITLNTEIIIQLVFGDKYMLSSGYLKLYIWTGLPYFIFFAFGHLIYTEEIIDKSLLMSVSLIISNLVLNYILIDVYGAYGAIYATLISTFISYVILYFIVKKYTKFYK